MLTEPERAFLKTDASAPVQKLARLLQEAADRKKSQTCAELYLRQAISICFAPVQDQILAVLSELNGIVVH